MCDIVKCGLPRSKMVYNSISLTSRFSEKKSPVTEHKMCVLKLPLLLLLSLIFLVLRRNGRDMSQKCVFVIMKTSLYSRPILMKIEFSRQIFEKSSNVKFHENPSSESRVVLRGQTDRHDGANNRLF